MPMTFVMTPSSSKATAMGTWLEYPFACAVMAKPLPSAASMQTVTPGTSHSSATKSDASGMRDEYVAQARASRFAMMVGSVRLLTVPSRNPTMAQITTRTTAGLTMLPHVEGFAADAVAAIIRLLLSSRGRSGASSHRRAAWWP